MSEVIDISKSKERERVIANCAKYERGKWVKYHEGLFGSLPEVIADAVTTLYRARLALPFKKWNGHSWDYMVYLK